MNNESQKQKKSKMSYRARADRKTGSLGFDE